jgi:hypothetical protein
MVFNTTFNNISAMSWQSVSLVEETGVPRENHQESLQNVGFFLFKKKLYYTFEVIFKCLHLLIQSGLVILKFGYNEK